ncbi:MAG: helicase C-terminal domain-containing protein [Pseudomonadota bacterium]
MGVLYPAARALSERHVERLFYLTSRGTGSLAALKACEDLATDGRSLRVVELIAKEKACPVEGMPCDESCPNAVGYYDRIKPALAALLECEHMNRAGVQAVAAEHSVCPFELSLDAALWADLTIGDYNYLLDPVVRLQRFAEDGSLGLLIDESHQLADRARDMLSLTLIRSEVQFALEEAPPGSLARRLRGLDRALMKLGRESASHSDAEPQHKAASSWRGEQDAVEISRPDGLLRAISRVLETLAEDMLDLAPFPACQQLIFTLSRWSRAEAWLQDTSEVFEASEVSEVSERSEVSEVLEASELATAVSHDDAASTSQPSSAPFRFYLAATTRKGSKREVVLRLACLDPSAYLRRTLAGYGPHVRFSGTVTPLPLYQSQHGQADATAERVESPFAAEQLATLLVRDLPVYYRNRQESLPRLAALVLAVAAAKPGNYLVALPSFEYLRQLQDSLAVEAAAAAGSPVLLVQTPGLSDPEREAFMAEFVDDGETRIALVVLGGVFAESVDFSHGTIAGVICVGVGLPPGSSIREAMRDHFDTTLGHGQGEVVAFQQPAMVKVLQMAGRLLRGPEDRGVLVLVDDRFCRPGFQQFFPGHWQPVVTPALAVQQALENFWQGATPLPRLRTS